MHIPTLRTVLAALVLAAGLLLAGAAVHQSTASAPSGTQLVATARTLVGAPYQWGATGPSAFDCSGFVGHVLARNGIRDVPRTSAEIQDWAYPISQAALRPGDLVFKRYSDRHGGKADHVSVYVGGGVTVGTSTAAGRVVERQKISRAVVSYGRVPGVAQSTAVASAGDGWAGGTTRAEAARIVADTLGLADRPNRFGVVTEGGAVGALHHAKIAYPYRDGRFYPHTPITGRQVALWLDRADVSRAQAARIFTELLGLEERPNPFGVRTEARAVGAVYHGGIGYPYRDGRWRPNVTITSAQLELWTTRAGGR